jgi:hypothetical protein
MPLDVFHENIRPEELLYSYQTYEVQTLYAHKSGKIYLPAGKAGALPEVCDLSAPVTLKIVRFYIERRGKQPVPPPVEPDTEDQVLLHYNPLIQTPTPIGREMRFALYTLAGEYVYLVRQAISPGQPINGTKLPIFGANGPYTVQSHRAVSPQKAT